MRVQTRAHARLFFAVALCVCIIAGCADNNNGTAGRTSRDTTNNNTSADSAVHDAPPLVVRYHRVPVAGRKGLDSLRDIVGEQHLMTVLRLNRKDMRHIARNDTLIVPDTLTDLMAYSPFPHQLASAEPVRKLLFVDQHIQAVAAYESGRLVFWGPTSTGKKSTPTDTGLFHTNWRSRKRSSTIDSDWIMEWYWNLENRSGVSMHQFDLPGYPASHACVRLLMEDAQWLYDWADAWRLDSGNIAMQGTPVIIYKTYSFGQRAPWKFLPEAPDTTRVSTDELGAVLAQYLPTILEEQKQRDSVLATSAQVGTQAVQPKADTSRKAPMP